MTAATHAPPPPIVLSIAGSDTSGGAGIQADIKTISACGAYAMTSIAAITTQDPNGVRNVWPVTPEQLGDQIEAALAYHPAVIKIGMLGNAALANVVADILDKHRDIPLVLDTVIRSSSSAALLDSDGVQILRERLLPRATIVTPNRQEARELFDDTNELTLQSWTKKTGVLLLVTAALSLTLPAVASGATAAQAQTQVTAQASAATARATSPSSVLMTFLRPALRIRL